MNNPITTLSRERLEQLADENTICKVSWDERIEMARALLAVMDAPPVSFYAGGAYYNTERAALKDGAEDVTPLYTTPPAPSAPDGWKLVPVEPTAKMMVAGTLVSEFQEDPAGMYRAMIAAAPE